MAYADLYDDPYQNQPPQPTYPDPGAYAPAPTTRDPNELLAAAERSAQGYNAPNYAAPRYQGGGVDATKWGDTTHTTPKYDVLRYLDQFDPRQLGRPGLTALSEEAKKYLLSLGYQIKDEDKIFRQDIGEIDVLHGDRSAYGWALPRAGNRTPRTYTRTR